MFPTVVGTGKADCRALVHPRQDRTLSIREATRAQVRPPLRIFPTITIIYQLL